MPTRKQRRRRDKSRRHEYEYVYVDETGNEVAVDPAELDTARERREKRSEPRRDSARGSASRRQTRPVEPPSLRRTVRRAIFIAPLMFAVIWFTGQNRLTTGQKLEQTIFLVVLFLPFSYLVDRLVYRAYQRRTGAVAEPAARRSLRRGS